MPAAASVLAQLVPCAQPEVESQTVAERFVARLLTACLRYPCANALHCATMQLMRWVTALYLVRTPCPEALCKCPPLCHHATHEVNDCALPCANALPWAVVQTPCPEALCKCPPLCHHETHEVSLCSLGSLVYYLASQYVDAEKRSLFFSLSFLGHCALPCANALHCAAMQVMRWVTVLYPCANAMVWGAMQMPCPELSCKCPALFCHANPCPVPSCKS